VNSKFLRNFFLLRTFLILLPKIKNKKSFVNPYPDPAQAAPSSFLIEKYSITTLEESMKYPV